VFAPAYSEIRFMLESNLMAKFVSTDEFENALAAAAARQNPATMSSRDEQ